MYLLNCVTWVWQMISTKIGVDYYREDKIPSHNAVLTWDILYRWLCNNETYWRKWSQYCILGIVHPCKYFPPDVRKERKCASNDAATLAQYMRVYIARMLHNRRSLVKKPANGENIYKNRLYVSSPILARGVSKATFADIQFYLSHLVYSIKT